jgi:hypothetical protein
MDSQTPETVEEIPFQIEETTPATVVKTVLDDVPHGVDVPGDARDH